jgi:hypothetical protein
MALVQKIFAKFCSPQRMQAMEESSRRWKICCKTCGFETSVWEAGGIRYNASSKAKSTLIKCPKCHMLRWAKVYRADP